MGFKKYLKKTSKRLGYGLSHKERMERLKHKEEVAKMEVGIAEQKSKITKLRTRTRKMGGGGFGGLNVRFRTPAEQKAMGYTNDTGMGFGMKKASPKTTIKRASPKVKIKRRKIKKRRR